MTGRRAGAALHKANPKMVAGFQPLSAGAAYGYAMHTLEAFQQFGDEGN